MPIEPIEIASPARWSYPPPAPVLPAAADAAKKGTSSAQAGDKGAENKPVKTEQVAPLPEPRTEVAFERHESEHGQDVNVVRILDRETGKPIFQMPPDGVLKMIDVALWRLREKGQQS